MPARKRHMLCNVYKKGASQLIHGKKTRGLPVAASLGSKLVGADATPGDELTLAVVVMTRSLNHLTATNADSNVVDGAVRRTVEKKITSRCRAGRNLVVTVAELALGTMREGLAGTLVDSVFGKTAAVETNDITIITIGSDVHLDTLAGTVIISTTPAVRVLADHAGGSVGDASAAVNLLSGDDESNKSKSNNSNKTHFVLFQKNLKSFYKHHEPYFQHYQ